MTRTVEEIMTTDPRTVATTDTVADAARQMRDADIGNVIVVDGEETAGIITDRDIVIRAIAEGRDPESTTVADVCTTGLTTLEPDQSIDEAVQIMRD
nr:CBS domain-containing protein [Solirubrobacterales bacterium]